MKELSLRQDRRPSKNVFYYSKYEEFSIEIMGDDRGKKANCRFCTLPKSAICLFSPDVR